MSAVEMPAAGDVPYVPEVWDGPLMSDVLRGGGVSRPTLCFRALAFRFFMFRNDRRMRVCAQTLACNCVDVREYAPFTGE